jgi:hypothetical protein
MYDQDHSIIPIRIFLSAKCRSIIEPTSSLESVGIQGYQVIR